MLEGDVSELFGVAWQHAMSNVAGLVAQLTGGEDVAVELANKFSDHSKRTIGNRSVNAAVTYADVRLMTANMLRVLVEELEKV